MGGFWIGPRNNDTIILGCCWQMDDPQNEPEHYIGDQYKIDVPAGRTYIIDQIISQLHCGAQWQNPVGVLMHIFFNEPERGRNTQIWSRQASFAQWQLITQTTGDPSVEGSIRPIDPPIAHLATDVGDGNYWRYRTEEVRLVCNGPGRVEVGMFNNNPRYPHPTIKGADDPDRSPAATAFLSFHVDTSEHA